jgi:hypothetical protein
MSVLTPEGQEAVNTTFGWSGRNIINPAATLLGTGIGAFAAGGAAVGATVGELADAAGVPGLGRDINIAAQTVPAHLISGGVLPPGGMPSDPRATLNSQRYVPPLEAAGPRFVSPNVLAPDAQRVWEARQAVRNALLPTPEEIVPSPPSSPTGISGPMPAPEGYVPPTPATAAVAPAFTGTPSTSAEAKQVASQYYKINAAQGDRAMPPEFINGLSDDLNAYGPKGPLETAVAGDNKISNIAAEVQKLRGQPTTLEDAQRTYSRLGDAATAEFRQNGNSETYHDLMQVQANMRDRLAPPDLAGDDPWTNARKAWSQAMKMQDLEQMKARADGTQNPTTSYKTQVNNMLNNPSRVRGYTDEEKAAVQDSAERGVIGGALHVFGSRAIPVIAAGVEMRHGPVSSAIAGAATYGMTSAMRGAENWLQTRRYDQALRMLGQGVPVNQRMQ